MGVKKRRRRKTVERPFCWYCERKFVDERVLIMHQKARHFKCEDCFKKLSSAIGLAVHQHQMHNKQLKGVPNAHSGHDSIEREIYGMDGLTMDEIIEFRKRTNPAAVRQKSRAAHAETTGKGVETSAVVPAIAAVPGQTTVVLVFSSVDYSQEELRAKLPRYKYDEAKMRRQLMDLDSAVESRLASLSGAHP